MTMNSACNIKTAVIFTAIISAFGASLSVSISAYGVSKHCVNCVQIRSFFWSVFSRVRTEYGEILCIWTLFTQWKILSTIYIYVRNHSFSTYANFSEKLTFLPPDRRTYVCLSGDKKRWFCGKFCVRTKWMIPY